MTRAPLPRFVAPQLATLVERAPEGDAWLHELKVDGYRTLARIERGRAALFSRSGLDWSARFPTLARALSALPVEQALLDGEVVVFRDGLSDFAALQAALSARGDAPCVYVAFDLLHLDGRDLRPLPLVERKELLRAALRGAGPRVRFSAHELGGGERFFRRACARGAEGAVCKRADAPYRSGRGRDWLKVKCTARQEFVIAGWTPPAGSRTHFGALLLGFYDPQKRLRYAGKVGTGFDARALAELHARLAELEQAEPAFADPPRGAEARGAHWVRPVLVAEIELRERTRAGRVRHASFVGLRDDKPARSVVLETPAPANPGPALTHPERVLYPEPGLTKADLAHYYAAVAPWMLPHVAGRPLGLVRCPEGLAGSRFFQKHPPRGAPAALGRVPIRERSGVGTYMTVADLEGLIALVQIGALEIHVWGARASDLERPDLVTFDLDPAPGVPFAETVRAARELRARLAALGLESFAKATGGKGLHVVVPLAPRAGWDEAKAFARALADAMVRDSPERYLAKASKAARRGRIFVDWLRNARGATAICPYSTRARPGAPVATPLAWSELTAALEPARFDVAALPRRLARLRRDPWEGYADLRQALPPSR